MKIKVTMLDSNSKYLNKITSALTSKFPDKVEMHAFTDKEKALDSLVKDKVDVFVASDSFDINPEQIPSKCAFAYFVDSEDIELLADYQTICRYQKIDVVFNRIQRVYLEKSAAIITSNERDNGTTKVVSFIAAAGGVGCSVAAASYALKCARLGKKVIYLNLDCFSSSDMFFSGEGSADLGDMIYFIKRKKTNLSLKHDSIVKRDESGVEFYSPTKLALDMKEFSLEEIRELIAQLRTWGNYDYIVIDTQMELTSEFISFLDLSNLIVMVTDGSEIANYKTERAIESIAILDQKTESNSLSKLGILYNRFSTKTSHKMDLDNVSEYGGIKRYEGYLFSRQLVIQIVRDSRAFDNML